MSEFFLSAAHKSSGKTTVSLGLVAVLKERHLSVQTFKKGPDYIDPIWLARASGRPCINLDFFTSTHDEIIGAWEKYSGFADVSIVEGNKGLFDGVDLEGADCNAALAKLLKLPVILVLDTQGITRGIAPILAGYQTFDSDTHIAGVILNKVAGPRHEGKLVAAVERYTDIKVLGSVRRFKGLGIEERHLGLRPANEDNQADEKISELASLIGDSVDLDTILQLSAGRHGISKPDSDGVEIKVSRRDLNLEKSAGPQNPTSSTKFSSLKIGISRDVAFGFYYQDDMEQFARAGVELVSIDTIKDKQLPADLDGLFLGGGFPETHMQALAKNVELRFQLKQLINSGLPTYAECGGLMYLSREIVWKGVRAPMVGALPASTIMQDRPQGRGYIELKETNQMLWPESRKDQIIRAHEFHYSQLEGLPEQTQFAYTVVRGVGIKNQKDGIIYKNVLASYAHLRDSGQNHWVDRFVQFVGNCRQ